MRPSGPGIRRVVTAALLLVLVASASGQGAERLAGGVSFYADFDQSVHAWYAVGEPAEQSGGGGTRLVPGLIGQAAQVGPAQGGVYRPLQYDAGRNIGTTGTLAFWINARFPWSRPGVSRTEETYRVLLNVPGPAGNFGFLLYHHEWPGTGPSSLYFCTYGLRPDHQSYSPAYEFPADSPWSPGEWHHLAWVWTPRLKQIYLDGNKVAEDDTPWQDDSFRFESPMTLGLRPGVESSSYVPAAATFDEWTIWNRTLSAEEVRQVHDLGKGGESLRDALSLAETQSAAKSRPPAAFRTGNLIPNGSFETWLRGGWIVEGLDDFAPPVELDGTPSPPDGRACARVPLRSPRPDRPPGGVILRQQLFQAKAGEPITLSAWARSDAPGATMDLRVWPSYVEASTRPTSRAFPLTHEWQRYGFTLTPTPAPWDAYFPEIGLTATSEGTVWLDAVQIEPGAKISPFRPYEPVEAGLVTDQPANLFLAGEPVRVRLALSLATPSDLGGL